TPRLRRAVGIGASVAQVSMTGLYASFVFRVGSEPLVYPPMTKIKPFAPVVAARSQRAVGTLARTAHTRDEVQGVTVGVGVVVAVLVLAGVAVAVIVALGEGVGVNVGVGDGVKVA